MLWHSVTETIFISYIPKLFFSERGRGWEFLQWHVRQHPKIPLVDGGSVHFTDFVLLSQQQQCLLTPRRLIRTFLQQDKDYHCEQADAAMWTVQQSDEWRD